MINTQKPESRTGLTDYLQVHSIFYTIQGEGPYAGQPAIFIRLAGCNIQCPGCDTEYTMGRAVMAVGQILERVLSFASRPRVIVITGGEPFRQNIVCLVDGLIMLNFKVQIESNGTLPAPSGLAAETEVVCSPKTGNVHKELRSFIVAYKYVAVNGELSPVDGLPLKALGSPVAPARPHDSFSGDIYITPMDVGDTEQNNRNALAAAVSCLTHGYTFNVQLHKIVNLP